MVEEAGGMDMAGLASVASGSLDWIGFPCEFVCDVYVMLMPPPQKKKNAAVQASDRR
jgi:hypothetical protein